MLNKSKVQESVISVLGKPRLNRDQIAVRGHIIFVLENIHTKEKRIYEAHNLISDAGDLYYAQRAASETPTNAFGIMELGSAGAAPVKGSNRSNMTTKIASSQKAFDATYPKTNDGDADNTGAGTDIISYRVSYATGEANDAAIDRLILTNVTPGASEPVMTYATFTAFAKTASDTLKQFVNHTFLGV